MTSHSIVRLITWVPGGLGSDGVFFCDLATGRVVVKAESTRSAGEYFCSLLANKLEIETPKMKALDAKEQKVDNVLCLDDVQQCVV